MKKLIRINPILAAIVVSFVLVPLAIVGCDSEPATPETPALTATSLPPMDASTATPQPSAVSSTAVPVPTASPQPTTTAVPAQSTPMETPQPVMASSPATHTPTTVPTPAVIVETVAITPTASPSPAATYVAVEPTPAVEPQPTTTVGPTPEPDDSLAFDPSVVRGTLANGMTYYIRHNEEPRDRAQLSLVVKAGSVLEEEDQRGLAHFVEHMAFNGTERFEKQQIVDYLESIGSTFGADLNAQTGYDSTIYWLEIPTDDPEVIETAFQILSDWAYAVTFSAEEVELERGVILEEWRLRQGFGSRLQDNLLPLLYGSSRYAERHPIGLPEVIETAPVERLQEFYERWYRPNLMAVIAVGDFNAEQIESNVTRHFSPPPEGGALQERAGIAPSTIRPDFDIPIHSATRVEVFSDPEAPGTQLILARKVAPETGRGLAAFRRGATERLAFLLMNARLAERRQASDPPYLWAGGSRGPLVESVDVVSFSAWVEQGGIERGLTAILEEVERAKRHGFTATELAREKINLLSSVESVFRQREQMQSADLSQSYMRHFLSGTPALGIEAEWELYQQILPHISLAEIDRVAANWGRPDNAVLLVMMPEGADARTDTELESTLQTKLATADSLEVEPYVDDFSEVPLLATLPTSGSITGEEHIESIDAQKWTMSNGITVIAKQTAFRSDEVIFGAFSPGGHSLVDDADHVSALYAARLAAGSGVGLHDNITLEKLLTGKRVAVTPHIGELFEGFRGLASPEDLETMFQLITLYATAPRLDPTYFSRFESSLRSIAETRTSQPDEVLYDTVNSLLSQNHFRDRPLSPELLDELSLERAEAVYVDRFADVSDATFIFVGAFEWEQLKSLTATYLASLPAGGRVEEWRDVGIDPPTGIQERIVRSGIEPRSITALVFTGEMNDSNEDTLALTAAAEMLEIRLRERVREELGGTYSIGVNASSNRLPDPEYQVFITYGSDPSRADELFDEVRDELDWLRAGGDQKYLDTAKELLRNPREEKLRSNDFWLGRIQSAVQRSEPFTEIGLFDERLEALTLEQIAAVAQLYLPGDRYLRVVLLPEEE